MAEGFANALPENGVLAVGEKHDMLAITRELLVSSSSMRLWGRTIEVAYGQECAAARKDDDLGGLYHLS